MTLKNDLCRKTRNEWGFIALYAANLMDINIWLHTKQNKCTYLIK